MIQLPAMVIGPAAAAAELARGASEVYCLMPDAYLELPRRRVAWVYLSRALRSAGVRASIWWAWYREDENGEPETVFRLKAIALPER